MTRIFLSYSHQDEAWKNKLVKHLKVLETAGVNLEVWEDRQIQAGDAWRGQITSAIATCDIALFLVSVDFLTSKFILGDEVPPLLQRRTEEGIRLIPIIVSSCVWTAHKWLADTQARPRDGKPLNKLGKAKQDEVLAQLTGELLKLHEQGTTLPVQNPKPAAVPASPLPDGSTRDLLPSKVDSQASVTGKDTATAPPATAPGASTLWGRDKLLDELRQGLRSNEALVVYGFRGNGKSSLIQSMQQQALPGVPSNWMRINAASERSAETLYARLAELLGDRSELPQVPTGTVDEMTRELLRRSLSPQMLVLWVDRGHTWFSSNGQWVEEKLGRLFRALRRAYGQRWKWVLELREQPASALNTNGTLMVEVPGIDRRGLGAWLEASAPVEQQAAWTYSGDALKRIYQWLGNRRSDDRSQAANPMATQLLIEVARANGQTPMQVLDRLLPEMEDRVDQTLLADLYHHVLREPEQMLMDALALYRVGIPLEHADVLEKQLRTPGAWEGLLRHCLLTADAAQERHHLHGFVAGWVRHRLGYPLTDELWTDTDPPDNLASAQRATLKRLHAAAAEAWLHQLGNTRRIAAPTLERAREALHHALSAGQAEKLEKIATELLGGRHRDEVLQRLWVFYRRLFERREDVPGQVTALQVITRLDQQDHKAWRFLGENLRRQKAPVSKVLHCFEQALAASPMYPPYLANFGQCLLDQGRDGAQGFLDRLEEHRRNYPEAVDDYVLSIEAACLEATEQFAQASQLRQGCITAGSRHPAFYSAEAEYQLKRPAQEGGGPSRALDLLDLAAQRGVDNDFTASVRATALQAAGRGPEASRLRQERIANESDNPFFYNAEAEYQLRAGNTPEAARLIKLASCQDPGGPLAAS